MRDDQRDHSNTIAVIGMAGRFPGARNIREFWDNLSKGVESVRTFSDDELRASGIDQAIQGAPNFVNAGAPLADADCFDAAFFGYTPREAQLMDPQQRVFLECAWAAMEDAGHDPALFDGDVGVFGGIARNTYFLLHAGTYKELMDKGATYDVTLGMDKDYPATRVAYQMDLRGPAMSIQTACSSSGVAIHMACQSLLNGECDMAMAGGARIQVPMHGGYLWTEGGIPSPDGHCRPFDKDAAGTVYGSGAAVVVLKRLEDALADGDHIYSLILGSAINNDGSAKVGFTAPSASGQADVIRAALAIAEVSADTISYVEAHGTGTAIGDPIEIAALTKAYRSYTDRTGYCAIGALKSNIGHLDAGAGVAGLIKASLMLHHKTLVPSINYSSPNPQIDLSNSPFFVSTQTRPWEQTSAPRRAGVSAFGLGGTNFHAVLQEAPVVSEPSVDDGRWKIVPLSAKSSQSLADIVASFADSNSIDAGVSLASVCHTLTTGRKTFKNRRVCVARSVSEMQRRMSAVQLPTARTGKAVDGRRRIAFVFPGQGGQYPHMGRGLYENEPAFRTAMDECRDLFEAHIGGDLWKIIDSDDSLSDTSGLLLDQTWVTQPAVFSMEYCLAQLWRSYGIEPEFVAGHSFGELAAACIAGIFSLRDAANIVAARGRLTHEAPPGAMLAVGLGEADVVAILPDTVEIATVNTPMACVVSGPLKTIRSFKSELDAKDVPNSLLHVSNGFHSSMMTGVVDEFARIIAAQTLNAPAIPVISSVTGAPLSDTNAADPLYWATQVVKPVRMIDSIGHLLTNPDMVLIEAGPGRALSSFAAQHPNRTAAHEAIQSLRHPDDEIDDEAFFRLSLGQAWCCGIELDLDTLNRTQDEPRVSLPTYAFERRRHWLSGGTTVIAKAEADQKAALPEPDLDAEIPRIDRIASALTRTLSDLSGFAPDEIDPRKSFVELGFDSLFLTRANAEFKKLSSVEIGFRQLFDEAPSVAELASYIDARLPADSRVFCSPASTAAPVAVRPQLGSAQDAARAGQATTYRTTLFNQSPERSAAASAPVGPWKPLATGDFGALTNVQQQHLADLIERLNRKTAGSKAYTQRHRSHLADPRTVAGFRRIWKELVYPVVVDRSKGADVWDIDGNRYTDIAMGFGVAFLGHNLDPVIEAVRSQLEKGVEIGPQHPLAGEVAERICRFTGMDRAAFCNTGSEAVLAAIRMARTATGRNRIAVFSGDYHGIFDEVLALRLDSQTGSRSTPVAPGIPDWAVANTLVLQHGDERSFEVIREYADELAAVIVEPVQSRHPDLQPAEYLRQLRKVTAELDVPLVLDEIITGFRCHPGGIQALWGVDADIATYGKAIGGGFPISVVAGKRRFMDTLDGGAWQFGDDSFPEVGVTWFAGTFVRHPAALAATNAALKYMETAGNTLQSDLNERTASMVGDLNAFLRMHRAPLHIETFSSLFHIKFVEHPEVSSLLYAHLRDNGIHVTEGRVAFLSTAHSEEHIAHFKEAFKSSILAMRAGGFLPELEVVEPAGRRSEYPLLPAQQEIWLAATLSDGANAAFNLTNTISFRGHLDTDRLTDCIGQLVLRHEALRTSFNSDGTALKIHDTAPFDVGFIDLADLEQDHQVAKLEFAKAEAASKPFDLAKAPLFRATLVRLSDAEHVLLMTAHHIVCDGWSTGVLLRELAEMYRRSATGAPMPELPACQLGDFIRRTRESGYRAKHEASLRYWQSLFQDSVPKFDIATDYERPARRTFSADRVDIDLDADLIDQLRSYAKSKNTTFFNIVLAAYALTVGRLSGCSDIVIGVSAAQQPAEGMHEMVGHAVSLLPIRFDVTPEQSMNSMITQVRGIVLDAFDHQTCSYGELLPHLDIDRTSSAPPLVNTVFNLDPSMQRMDFGDVQSTVSSVPRQYETFDIFFNIVDLGKDARIECTFNRDLYDRRTISDRLDGYVLTLYDICARKDPRLADVRIIGSYSRSLIDTSNATTNTTLEPRTITEILDRGVARQDSNVVELASHQSMSVREIHRRANQLAHFLVRAGVSTNSLVGICMDRSIDLVIAIIGTLKAGAAYVPVDPDYPIDRIRYILEDSDAPVVLTTSAVSDRLVDTEARIVRVDAESDLIAQMPSDAPSVDITPETIAYVMYTSGSTGKPKGSINCHAAVCNWLNWMQSTLKLEPADSVLQKTPFSFDVSVREFLWPLAFGADLVIPKPGGHRDPAYLADMIHESHITIVHFVPSMLQVFLDEPNLAARCQSVRMVICSGEALSDDLRRKFFGIMNAELHNLYGPTETAIEVTHWQCTADSQGSAVPIGYPIANSQIRILDPNLNEVPVGVDGELYICGIPVGPGYWRRPELTASVFVPDPFVAGAAARMYKTGDLARWRHDGSVEYRGRIDFQVKIRGLRIELGEIEAALAGVPGVRNAVASVYEPGPGDVRLVAYVVPDAAHEPSGDDLRQSLERVLPIHMVPQHFVRMHELPLTPNGKLDRKALPAPDTQDVTAGAPPETATELKVASIWRDVLRGAEAYRDTNFFAAGGHSLLAIRVLGRIRDELGVDLPLVAIFDNPTLRSICEKIDALSDASPRSQTTSRKTIRI